MILTYAKIDTISAIVVNTQLIDSGDDLDPSFTWVDITDMEPMPGIGWTYDGSSFSPPEQG